MNATPASRSEGPCAELARENARLRETLDNMVQGVILCDADERVIVCNERYIAMYGLSKEVVKPGCTLHQLIEHRRQAGSLAQDVESYYQAVRAALATGETTEQFITTPDGRTIHIVNQPLRHGGWVVTHEDVSRQKEAEAQIAHLAHHDALTDLPNRALFHSQLEHALRWRGRNEKVAVLFIDLDNFKSINDTLGHQIGDELLKRVAERLRECVRETDVVARLGGDEFVVVQTHVENPADAAALATRIREAILASCEIADHNIIVDTSIGIAIAPGDGTTQQELIKNADLALYGAKASGRGTYRFFEPEMDALMIQRHALERDLRRALINGELEIHYQPLVNLERDEISCCEALLRWRHPERGFISPDEFIPLAEETGLITRIGDWVIRTACEEAARWDDHVTLAVNISPVQFRNRNLVQVITHALATSGLAPRRLELEITEAILLDQTEATLATLNQLHTLGVKIVMDDFGTGYSSLSYLQKFPFDKIKIDASFIANLSERQESTAIVRAVTSLAQSFHMITTAEGVETAEQLRIVRELGCTEMQGHFFAQACTAEEVERLLTEGSPDRLRKAGHNRARG